jgi:hypothetical protein
MFHYVGVVPAGGLRSASLILRDGFAIRGWTDRFSVEKAPHDRWIDVSLSGETVRLRDGEKASVGDYCVSALRCSNLGLPGWYECLATSHDGTCAHASVASWAKHLTGKNGGLAMTTRLSTEL